MTVRAYTGKDLDSMVRIWNQVVEDGWHPMCTPGTCMSAWALFSWEPFPGDSE